MPGWPGHAAPDPPEAPKADPTDGDLLRAHVTGDAEAFGTLFVRHRERLWAVAVRTLGDPDEAADALQDAMMSAFRRAADFRGESAVTTWLHRIVVNACLDRMRRRAARPAATGVDEDSLDLLSLGTLGPGISPADPDTALDVQAALRALGPEQRAALVLVDMLGYPVADAAQILGISPGTVKSRCARGRARLLPRLAHLRGGTDGPDGPMAAAQPLADQADRSLREPSGGNQPVPPRVLPAEGGGESRP